MLVGGVFFQRLAQVVGLTGSWAETIGPIRSPARKRILKVILIIALTAWENAADIFVELLAWRPHGSPGSDVE